MMISAEEALARAVAAHQAAKDELKDAIVAILLAAVSLEAATHWVAETIGRAFRDEIESLPLDQRWARVVDRRDGKPPPMGSGLGHAVTELADDRNEIAHYPGSGRSIHETPKRRGPGKGMSRARSRFTATRAKRSIETATKAIAAIGETWARAELATR